MAARDEERKRAEEARKAAELQRKEEETQGAGDYLPRSAAERKRNETVRRSLALSSNNARRRSLKPKSYKRLTRNCKLPSRCESCRGATGSGDQRAEAAQQTAKVALATQPDLKPGIWPPVHLDVQAGGFFAEKDAKRVASLGEKYKFLIPDFRMDVPGNDVQSSLRGFVGIWLDGEGKGRTHLIIVTRVHQDGTADGFPSSGPPTPSSFDKRASWSRDNCRKDSGDTLRFPEPKGLSSTGSF